MTTMQGIPNAGCPANPKCKVTPVLKTLPPDQLSRAREEMIYEQHQQCHEVQEAS